MPRDSTHRTSLFGQSQLDERQAAYCSCTFKTRLNPSVYNPYAICTKSVHPENRPSRCLMYMDIDQLSDQEIVKYMQEHKEYGTPSYLRQRLKEKQRLELDSHSGSPMKSPRRSMSPKRATSPRRSMSPKRATSPRRSMSPKR